MDLKELTRRLLGVGGPRGPDGDDDARYRCIRCGDEFQRDHHDCPTCGKPYVAEIE